MSTEKQPDILIYLSDQHSPIYSEVYGNETVKTPNLNNIAKQGTKFSSAYTSCPLCVPSRMSMLSGRLPSKINIFTNKGALPEDQVTFLHMLAMEGYETVLCGRMHFIGLDQRHGFSKRIMGDITTIYWGESDFRRELGELGPTVGEDCCLSISGGGVSPIIEYDRAVVNAAIEYLKEEHEKPQCIVVGTYAPHFSYIAPEDLYKHYKEAAELPKSFTKDVNYDHPILAHKKQKADEDKLRSIRAAYFGMITNMDRQIGELYKAWKERLNKGKKQGVFVYMSDHGDQIGEGQFFGKKTFFEGSSRIPLIFEGHGIAKGHNVEGAVSIMDLGPTLCDLIGTKAPPACDGESLIKLLTSHEDNKDRYVISEFVERVMDKYIPGRMIRKGKWKLVTYLGYEEHDLLFDLEEDPFELNSVIKLHDKIALELIGIIYDNWDTKTIIDNCEMKDECHSILNKWGCTVGAKEKERWKIPHEFVQFPNVY